MKKVILILISAALSVGLQAQQSNAKKSKPAKATAPAGTAITLGAPVVKPMPPVLKNAKDSASYAQGIVLGTSMKRQIGTTDLDRNLIIDAIMATLKEDSLAFTSDNASKIFNNYQKAASMKANEANVKMSEDYLVNNKKRKGVTTTTSGLQYEIMKAADNPGPKPVATDKVKVHYVGTTVDGQEFDSSVRRGQPAEFPLGGVIKGWTEGLQYMNVGDKYKFVIPQNLAYGERSPSAKIKPFSTLIFEVELLEITTNK